VKNALSQFEKNVLVTHRVIFVTFRHKIDHTCNQVYTELPVLFAMKLVYLHTATLAL